MNINKWLFCDTIYGKNDTTATNHELFGISKILDNLLDNINDYVVNLYQAN